jgi:hypothetical protein
MEKPLITNSKESDRSNKAGGTLMNKHIVQLIRERFYPLVRFCGPQSAGEVEVEGVRGTVYLGELSIWLWPAKSSHNGILSDEQLRDVVSPHLLVRNLLSSAQALLRYYLEDSAATVVDGMALGRILGPRIGETAQ